MSNVVFIVTTGEYSSYGIESVHTDREVAVRRAALVQGEVEEWPIDAPFEDPRPGRLLAAVDLLRDGSIHAPPRQITWYPGAKEWEELRRPPKRREDRLYDPSAEGPTYLTVVRWVRDLQDVVKLANEVRARMVAEGAWE